MATDSNETEKRDGECEVPACDNDATEAVDGDRFCAACARIARRYRDVETREGHRNSLHGGHAS